MIKKYRCYTFSVHCVLGWQTFRQSRMCWCIRSGQGSCLKSSLRQKNCGTLTTVSLFPACLFFVFLSACMIVFGRYLENLAFRLKAPQSRCDCCVTERARARHIRMFEWKSGAWDSISHEVVPRGALSGKYTCTRRDIFIFIFFAGLLNRFFPPLEAWISTHKHSAGLQATKTYSKINESRNSNSKYQQYNSKTWSLITLCMFTRLTGTGALLRIRVCAFFRTAVAQETEASFGLSCLTFYCS